LVTDRSGCLSGRNGLTTRGVRLVTDRSGCLSGRNGLTTRGVRLVTDTVHSSVGIGSSIGIGVGIVAFVVGVRLVTDSALRSGESEALILVF
jgi:hypothetical protein